MLRRFVVVVVCGLAALVAGCGGEKKGALEGLEKIKGACAENDKDLAKSIAEGLRKSNKVFEKAFDAAIDDKRGSVNYCSPLLHNEVQLRIEHGTD
jgi:hypothetical protein